MINIKKTVATGAAALTMLGAAIVPAFADTININFEPATYSLGNINGQDGWSKTGPFDVEVESNTYGFTSFGTQSLRISDAIVSGSFGDQTFSKSLINASGETSAEYGSTSGGTKQPYFEASWDFASTVPGAEQPGLSVVASPDRGDGARMSWVQMTDKPTGIELNFYDYQTGIGFVQTNLASGLDRTSVHNIKITMQFVDGVANDIVKVYVDGVLKHTGTSWEDYFRDVEGNPTRTVDSILFRTSVASDSLGEGFLIDNFNLLSGSVPPVLVGPPTNKDECKKDGWKTFNNPSFKNQGQCVSYANHN